MKSESPQISLPKSWSKHVRAAILHVISLAQFATAHTRSWAANSVNARIRLKAERDRAVQELALLREEIRIKDTRMAIDQSASTSPLSASRTAGDPGTEGCSRMDAGADRSRVSRHRTNDHFCAGASFTRTRCLT